MSSKSNTIEGVRLDKWLWAARFYKTRSVARNMVDGGKVHYNGQRAKPSKIIDLGAEVKLRQGNNEEITVIVEIISDQRRGAPVAQTLYKETQSSIERREENAKLRKLNSLGSPHPEIGRAHV